MARSTKRVFIYSDAVVYGGHEAMTLRGINALLTAEGILVSVMYCKENTILSRNLEELAKAADNVRLLPVCRRPRRLQTLWSLVDSLSVRRIQRLLREEKPDIVVVSQGRIESGSAGLLAAKRAGLRIVSYIPMAHPAQLATPIAAGIRNYVNRYYYGLPHKFITVNEITRRSLLDQGAKAKIDVVPNCVERFAISSTDRERFRMKHNLKQSDYVAAVVGRIDFRQKGQDFAVRSIARFKDELPDFKFVFVGDGPDEGRLRALISAFNLEQQAFVVPRESNRSEIYGGIDLLLIPSKFEGVPLVMLEAMLSGVRIAASQVDGMSESLPRDWLFPFGDMRAFATALVSARNEDASRVLDRNRGLIEREYSVKMFETGFRTSVLTAMDVPLEARAYPYGHSIRETSV